MPVIWIIGVFACFAITTGRKWNDFGEGHMGFDTGALYAAIWSVFVAGFALAFVLNGVPEAAIAVVFPLMAAGGLLGFRHAVRKGSL